MNTIRVALLGNMLSTPWGGKAIFLREYDQKGIVKKEEGMPVQLVYNRKRLRLGEKFELVLLVGGLPHWNTSIVVTELNEGEEKLITQIGEKDLEVRPFGKRKVINRNFASVGTYHWIVNADITDRNNNTHLRFLDTVVIEVK